MKLAIVGSGISGLAVAHTLKDQADITVFEAGDYFGGHTHTVDVTLPTPQGRVTHGVDTGFLVFNERTYPNLINLFAELQVETVPSDMSFSVKVPGALNGKALEWSGTDLNSVFAQRGNLVNPRFWRMLADVVRFNALCTRIAKEQREEALQQPLADFLRTHQFSEPFRDWYFLPMLGCIWSCPTDQMLQFPVATMIRFCHNHGLIQVTNRPQWFSVLGGARNYVEKILAGVHDKRLNTPVRLIERDAQGVRIVTDGHAQRFDQVVIATHTNQALTMLRAPSAQESSLLGAIRYQDNRAVLHTDASVLPAHPKTWPRGTTSVPPAARANRRAFACITCSTVCNASRLPSPWWSRSTLCKPSTRPASSASTTTRTRCLTWPLLRRKNACLRCKASSAPGTPGRGRATAFTKTA